MFLVLHIPVPHRSAVERIGPARIVALVLCVSVCVCVCVCVCECVCVCVCVCVCTCTHHDSSV